MFCSNINKFKLSKIIKPTFNKIINYKIVENHNIIRCDIIQHNTIQQDCAFIQECNEIHKANYDLEYIYQKIDIKIN